MSDKNTSPEQKKPQVAEDVDKMEVDEKGAGEDAVNAADPAPVEQASAKAVLSQKRPADDIVENQSPSKQQKVEEEKLDVEKIDVEEVKEGDGGGKLKAASSQQSKADKKANEKHELELGSQNNKGAS